MVIVWARWQIHEGISIAVIGQVYKIIIDHLTLTINKNQQVRGNTRLRGRYLEPCPGDRGMAFTVLILSCRRNSISYKFYFYSLNISSSARCVVSNSIDLILWRLVFNNIETTVYKSKQNSLMQTADWNTSNSLKIWTKFLWLILFRLLKSKNIYLTSAVFFGIIFLGFKISIHVIISCAQMWVRILHYAEGNRRLI